LRALESHAAEAVVEPVRPLLSYPAEDVQQAAIRVLAAQRDRVPYDEIAEHLVEMDRARNGATGALRQRAEWDADVAVLHAYLQEEAPELVAAETAEVVCYGPEDRRACLNASALEALVDHHEATLRRAL